jgi:type IV pilus assembly protein PilW
MNASPCGKALPAQATGANRSAGVSLVDVLVGVAVAMIAIVVISRAFVALDALRRGASGASDAQIAGTFALDAITAAIANAGAGWSAASAWLDTCPATSDIATTLRPISAVIFDSGSATMPDAIVVRQALHAGAIGASYASAAAAASDFTVESVDRFAVGDRVVAVSRAGTCAATQLTSVSVPASGLVRLGHAPVAVDFPLGSVLLDLGPAGRASTLRFDVAAGTLRSTDLANGDAPIPLAANVVNVKFQYGVDDDGDGALDTWVSASGAWSSAALLAAPLGDLARIKAIRVGLVVRSDERERSRRATYSWVLFDCERADKTTCPGRLTATLAPTASGNYRYRTLETVVPLRNVAWNAGT